MNIKQLNQDFNNLNLSKEKNSMERLEFCWKLIESDFDNVTAYITNKQYR